MFIVVMFGPFFFRYYLHCPTEVHRYDTPVEFIYGFLFVSNKTCSDLLSGETTRPRLVYKAAL